jgi:hypothetical protein
MNDVGLFFCSRKFKSFIHVSVRTDDKVYNCKTAAITFIYLSIVSMIS